MESCRRWQVEHLVFASSSSVYAANTKIPFSVCDNVDRPLYGPWGRPDMAMFLFTKAIFKDRSIDVFNYGKMRRDFTYIDDIVEGVVRVLDCLPEPNPNRSGDGIDLVTTKAPYQIYNIGNNQAVELGRFIEVLENCVGKKLQNNFLPLQPGNVLETYANIDDLERDVGFKPRISMNFY